MQENVGGLSQSTTFPQYSPEMIRHMMQTRIRPVTPWGERPTGKVQSRSMAWKASINFFLFLGFFKSQYFNISKNSCKTRSDERHISCELQNLQSFESVWVLLKFFREHLNVNLMQFITRNFGLMSLPKFRSEKSYPSVMAPTLQSPQLFFISFWSFLKCPISSQAILPKTLPETSGHTLCSVQFNFKGINHADESLQRGIKLLTTNNSSW